MFEWLEISVSCGGRFADENIAGSGATLGSCTSTILYRGSIPQVLTLTNGASCCIKRSINFIDY
jgi:hypothetical protein